MQIVGLANKPSLPILGINYFIDSFLVILAALSSSLRYFFELASNHFSLSPNTPHPHRITLITMTFQPELSYMFSIKFLTSWDRDIFSDFATLPNRAFCFSVILIASVMNAIKRELQYIFKYFYNAIHHRKLLK